MIPYHDENQTVRTPIVTLAIIAACVAMWILVQGAGAEEPLARSVCNLGLIPGELLGTVPPGVQFQMTDRLVCVTDAGPEYMSLITSMFLHGGWMHLIGNMWFLWLFGNNVEDAMTRPRFVVFYLVCGLAAAMFQVFAEPDSGVPMVGASGAISGVMGAYLILFPRVRVFTLVPLGFFLTSIALPAWVMLLYWMFLQFIGGIGAVVSEPGGGVAFWAHIGGFLAGIVLVKLFASRSHAAAHRRAHWAPDRVGF